MTRDKAIDLLHIHTKNENLRRHMYAVGFAMAALAKRLGGDENEWEILGLLHDADWEETKDMPDQHTIHTLAWLKGLGITDGPIVHALMSHNNRYTHLAELEGKMEWALETVDELTGFIVAVTLVRPDPPSPPAGGFGGQGKSRLQSVEVGSIMKKWGKKEFAAAVDRKQIEQCEEKLGIPLPEFIAITLSAMQNHHEKLGL